MTALESQCEKTIESMRSLFESLLRRNAELEAENRRLQKQVGELEDQIFDMNQLTGGQAA